MCITCGPVGKVRVFPVDQWTSCGFDILFDSTVGTAVAFGSEENLLVIVQNKT